MDVDGNGQREPLLTYYNDGQRYPFYGRDLLVQQTEGFEARFPSYESFGARQIRDIVPADRLEEATMRSAQTFAHVWAENRSDGTFTIRELPAYAQVAPIYSILADDIDADGRQDLIVGGNFTECARSACSEPPSRGVSSWWLEMIGTCR